MKELSFEQMEEVNGGGWGDDTLDCIEDAYTNHGWISVWAWVQTGFIPQTGALIAAYCAGYTF